MKDLIVHIIDRLPPDGAERLIAEVLRNRSDKYRYEVLCLVEGGDLVTEIEQDGVPVTVLGRKSARDLNHAYRLYRWFREHRPKVVHTHLFTADAWGRVFAWLARVPGIFSTVHSTNAWKSKLHLYVDWLLAYISDSVVACTDEVKSTLLRQSIASSKVISIANGVDLQRVENQRPVDLKKEFGLTNTGPVFALVGRLHEAKGHTDLLPVLQSLVNENINFTCLFVGEGELDESLKQAISDRGLSQQVIFTGFRSDVIGIMKSIDFMVMPSRWEGLPISLLESMACLSPVLASDVGGIPDVIEHGVDGRLYQQGDEAALKSELTLMIQDSGSREVMAKVAREKIENNYSAASVALAYEALYDTIEGVR